MILFMSLLDDLKIEERPEWLKCCVSE